MHQVAVRYTHRLCFVVGTNPALPIGSAAEKLGRISGSQHLMRAAHRKVRVLARSFAGVSALNPAFEMGRGVTNLVGRFYSRTTALSPEDVPLFRQSF